jgi:hypothetical protein
VKNGKIQIHLAIVHLLRWAYQPRMEVLCQTEPQLLENCKIAQLHKIALAIRGLQQFLWTHALLRNSFFPLLHHPCIAAYYGLTTRLTF